MRGLFITGTGTGVGKTILSAALLAAMAAAGERVRAHKPVVTGLDESEAPDAWPPDHELLARVAGMSPKQVAPLRYAPAVSPHLAARLAGDELVPDELIARARAAAGAGDDTLIVEGVGGLLVPLSDDFTVRDLALALGLPLIIAATPGLGTINHTLLTLESARAAGLDVRAVVLTPWTGASTEAPTASAEVPTETLAARFDTSREMERSNRETIERLGRVEVACLGRVQSPSPSELARAGRLLPWQRWCPPKS